jgi:hypothetical protein
MGVYVGPLLRRSDLTRVGGAAADYVEYVADARGLNGDFFNAMLAVIFPSFVRVGDALLVADIGAVERYAKHRDRGLSSRESEYWANLFLVSDLLRAISLEEATRGARLIARGWSISLQSGDYTNPPPVRIIYNDHEAEVYVVCSSWEGNFREIGR